MRKRNASLIPWLADPYAGIYVEQIEHPSGKRSVNVWFNGKTGKLSAEDCSGSSATMARLLAPQGIILVGKKAQEALVEKINGATLRRSDVLEHPGRHKSSFGLISGDVLNPGGVEDEGIAYTEHPHLLRVQGSTSRWKQRVGKLLSGQHLLQLASFLPLMAGLREMMGEPGSVVIEILCPAAGNREDVTAVAASVQGIMNAPIPFEAFVNEPQEVVRQYRGALLLLGDPGRALAADAPARRETAVLQAVRSWASSSGVPSACVFPTTKALADWAGTTSETAKFIAEQVITLQVDETNPFGVYQSASDGGTAALSTSINTAARRVYGAPYRGFMMRIVQRCYDDEERFRRDVESRIDAFVRFANVDLHDSIASREARSFGYIYAAAKIAQRERLLPAKWKISRIIARSFKMKQMRTTSPREIGEIIDKIASAPTTLRLDAEIEPSMEEIEAHHAFVRYKGQRRKLYVRQTSINLFPEFRARIYESDTKGLLISPDPIASKQRLGRTGLKRVYAFKAF